ncbi:MAG: PAS domain S-box protein [Methanomicrobiales archaeon]|nr:PAS domain S-box protein [Methanomicrobiales archaeon]
MNYEPAGSLPQDDALNPGNTRHENERAKTSGAAPMDELLFRTLFLASPLATFIWQHRDSGFSLAEMNRAAEALVRGQSPFMKGANASVTFAGEPDVLDYLNRCFSGETGPDTGLVTETLIPGRAIHVTASRLSPYHIALSMQDISEWTWTEEALRHKTALFEAQLHSSTEGIIVSDATGKKILQNGRVAEIWKIPKDTARDPDDALQIRHMMGMTRDPERFAAHARHLFSHPYETCNDMVELVDGTIIARDSAPVIGKYGKNYGRIWKFRDITEQRKAELALKESEEKFRRVVESAPAGIFIVIDDRFAYLNPAACRLFGTETAGPLEGTPVIDRIHPDCQGILADRLRILNEERQPIAVCGEKVFRVDGTVIIAEVSAVPIVFRGRDGALFFITDITERKQAEDQREALISELARKNAELDRFTYTVSHDLKSPLLALRAFLSLLEEDIRAGDIATVNTDIERIGKTAEKLEDLINNLLLLSRSGRIVDSPIPVSFKDLAAEAAALLDTTYNKRRVKLTIQEGLPVVMGDRVRLLQVMTNLLDNAVKYMGDQQVPRVVVGSRKDEAGLVLYVQDNGEGITEENLKKVFDLYERLNPEVPGTGIGLATVKRIIEAHGGKIWVKSEGKGKGATFFFVLPPAGKNGAGP